MGLPGQSFQGDSYYRGENLPSVAMFTYYLKDEIQSIQEQRREREKRQLAQQFRIGSRVILSTPGWSTG